MRSLLRVLVALAPFTALPPAQVACIRAGALIDREAGNVPANQVARPERSFSGGPVDGWRIH